ncbi:K(+)-transporting ATPase subunit F [Paenibacillus physcomitrellae]
MIWVLLALTAALFLYLTYALIHPEEF